MKKDAEQSSIWALVPAAGVGARMSADRPKQYLPIAGKTILEHSVSVLLNYADIAGVQLCLSPDDAYWNGIAFEHEKLLPIADGGAERADSVLAGLQALSSQADDHDWVMVHDAARPCLSTNLLDRLIANVSKHPVGGILAVPVADTIKQVNTNSMAIEQTIDRSALWLAQTPQMFRFGLLRDALQQALQQGSVVTDEASALEAAGYQPVVVASDRSNIKATYAEDMEWLEYFLSHRD